VVRWAAQVDLALIVQPLLPWAAAAGPDPFDKLGPAPAGVGKGSSDLTAGVGFDPSSALLIADNCAIMGKMRDTRGNIDQPTWYGALGVLAQTVEAPAIAHEWSKGHPNYSKAETDTKLAQAGQFPPTTCDKLGEQWSDVCKACPHFGQIKSPIVLGRERAKPSTIETVEQTVAADGTIHETRRKLWQPNGYGEDFIDGRRVLTFTTIKRDKEGAVVERRVDPICNTFFWAVTRLWVDDASQIEWEMETREGPRRFIMAGGLIGKGGAEVSAALGANEIIAKPGRERQVHTYMGHWMANLTATSDQVLAYKSFGWAGEKFVTGDVVLSPNAPDTRAIMVPPAKALQDHVACKGDLATWVAMVDRAYNAPGQEAFQFQVLCAFAAPLLSLMQQVRGVTVYAHSSGSGVGKTTVQKVGLSAWGNWDKLMLAHGKTTANAMWGYMGAYNSLPVVYDELTNADKTDISELVFSVSSGRAKERMNANGEMRTNNSNWSTILMASGNQKLSEKLSLHRSNTEAEISRLFEFTLTHTPHLEVNEANALFKQIDNHYGHAGRVFAKYVTDRKPGVVEALRVTQERLTNDLQLTQIERHWSALFSAVLVALSLCRTIGLLQFEPKPLRRWIIERLAANRDQAVAAVMGPEEQINQMINALWPGIIVTEGLGDLRRNIVASVVKPVNGVPIVGRVVRSTHTGEPNEMLISRIAINAWANENGASSSEMFEKAQALGWITRKPERFNLGKGTKEYSSDLDHTYCWQFNQLAMSRAPGATVVQQLNAVAGGKP
jgi:hypothetical protein